MNKRTRRILFIILLILFVTAAPLTIFYSLGWRFNWETKTIIQPGVFFFKVWPRSAEIYINNKLEDKTDFFFGSVLIENLSPKKHEIEIKKDGFHSWKKALEIKEREVTEAKNIVLIPEAPEFTNLAKTTTFYLSPDEKKIVLREEDSERWALKLFELEKNLKSHLIEEKDISLQKIQLLDLQFSPDSKRILLELGLKERLEYYLLEIDNAPPVSTRLYFLPSQAEKVYFHPRNEQKLLVLKKGALIEVDLLSKEISPTLLENIIALSFSNNDIFYLDDSGFLSKTNLSFNRKDKLNIIPFSIKPETAYQLAVSSEHIVLKENNSLYLFDKDKESFEKISDSVKSFNFSPDSRKLAFSNNYEIWVLCLEKITDSPQKQKGDKIFLTRFSEEVKDLFWFTNHYLIFTLQDKVKIAETDDRDRINVVDLKEFKTPEIFWSRNNKKLYVLSEENLFASERLTP